MISQSSHIMCNKVNIWQGIWGFSNGELPSFCGKWTTLYSQVWFILTGSVKSGCYFNTCLYLMIPCILTSVLGPPHYTSQCASCTFYLFIYFTWLSFCLHQTHIWWSYMQLYSSTAKISCIFMHQFSKLLVLSRADVQKLHSVPLNVAQNFFKCIIIFNGKLKAIMGQLYNLLPHIIT